MGPARPVDVKRVGAQCHTCLGLYYSILVVVVRKRFLGGEKGCTYDGTLSTQRKGRSHCAAVRNAARGEDRNLDSFDNLRNKRQKGSRAADMATRFDALSDYDMRARLFGLHGFCGGSYLANDENARCTETIDGWAVEIPKQTYDRDPFGNAGVQFRVEEVGSRRGRNQIDAEIPLCCRTHFGDLRPDEIGAFPHHAQKAEASGIRNGGYKLRPRNTAHAGQDDRNIAA